MISKISAPPKNLSVVEFAEFTDQFENKLSDMIYSAFHLSTSEKNEVALELEDTVKNIQFMIQFLLSNIPKES